MTRCDIAIVGAGIAGATLAAELARHRSVVLLEAESVAGYHSTGRSAAFWSETYGGPGVQPLTSASGTALAPYLDQLGSIHIGRESDAATIDTFLSEFADSGVRLERCDPATLIPGLRSEWTLGVIEPSCAYIDVARLHGDALAGARRAGVELHVGAELLTAQWDNRWQIETTAGVVEADVIVNAAGAWADTVAERAGVAPIGIAPYRRTMVQLRADPLPPAGMPMIADIAGSFYFKPEGGARLWLSPHDEIATPPCDAQPAEIDIAIAVDRFERVVDWRVEAVERSWAGLRSFAADRLPVYGFDPHQPAFFWCAGQGGFGIQTAPAAARHAAALLLGETPPFDPATYSPGRFTGVT